MFEDSNEIKQKILDFLQNEIDEIKENKMRFLALVFSFIFSISLMFVDDSGEKIDLNEPVQVEEQNKSQEKNVDENKKITDKKIISVKKDSEQTGKGKIVAVLGANSDELYIGDPFQSEEEKPLEIKEEDSKIFEKVDIPPQIPIIPPQQNQELPPIPSGKFDLPPIPSMSPLQMAEHSPTQDEYILTGTAINSDKKAAVVKKFSTTQGKNATEEDIILTVGDVLDGRQIVDITEGSLIFDDGNRIRSSYLDVDISTEPDEIDDEISDIPENFIELSTETNNFFETNIPVIPDTFDYTNQNFSDKNNLEISTTVVIDNVTDEDEPSFIKIDDKNSDLNSDTTGKLTELETDTSNINVTVDNDADSAENSLIDVNLLPNGQNDISFIGNNSP